MFDSSISQFYTMMSQLGYQHPLHPTQVHFPVGLIFGAFVLGLAGRVRHRPPLSRAALYCMILAMIWVLPTVITGLMDWKHFYAGAWLFPFAMKFTLATVLAILLVVGGAVAFTRGTESAGLIAVNALLLLTVATLGYFGGELVYGNRAAAVPAESVLLQGYEPGRTLYAANCGGCHANGGNVIKPELPVKNSPKTADFQSFRSWIRNPSPPMPTYSSTVLTDQQARDIFQYVTQVLNRS